MKHQHTLARALAGLVLAACGGAAVDGTTATPNGTDLTSAQKKRGFLRKRDAGASPTTPDAGAATTPPPAPLEDAGAGAAPPIDPVVDVDAGPPPPPLPPPDAGATIPDAGATTPDAGATTPDAGATTPDAGATTPDAGATTPAPSALLFDDFDAGIGRWLDWYGSPGWVFASNGRLAITPAAATHGAPLGNGDYDYTHAAIAAYCPARLNGQCNSGGALWKNVAYEARVNTVRQTRTGGAGNEPNAWEVAWIMFRFKDERHYYYMHFKTHHLRDMSQDYGGIEIGKYNCSSTCGLYEQQAGQEVIWSISANDLRNRGITYAALDTWYAYRIETRDVLLPSGRTGVNIIVEIDGIVVANVTDDGNQLGMGHATPTPPITGGAGSIALYTEDAAVLFDDVKVTPLP